MKKQGKKLAIHRETLRILGNGELRLPAGLTGPSEVISYCASDGFPGNCRTSWDGSCQATCVGPCTFTVVSGTY